MIWVYIELLKLLSLSYIVLDEHGYIVECRNWDGWTVYIPETIALTAPVSVATTDPLINPKGVEICQE